MTIKVGEKIPSVQLVKVTKDGSDQIDSESFFRSRKIALFAVPGAFTPTCSAQHLPGFIDNEERLKAKGVDEIVCTAVNDPFVLDAWSKANDAGGVTMLSDGNGDFARAVGLTMDGSKFAMGERSQRYSMIVDDGVVAAINIEQPGEFKVSSAEHLIATM